MSNQAYRGLLAGLALVIACPLSEHLSAQTPAEQEIVAGFNEATKAQETKNYPLAIQRLTDLLARHPNHALAPKGRYTLGLCLLEIPAPNYAGAVEQLKQITENKDLTERPSALYHLGVARRGLGRQELAQANGKPEEAEKRQTAARLLFEDAAKQFAAAADLYSTRAPKPDGEKLPPDYEAAVRARCAQIEMLLVTDKAKEARELILPLLKDPALDKTRYRNLTRYYHGWASFALDDTNAAGRSLSLLAPFSDAAISIHARYLLARVHHAEDERAEAAAEYEAVLKEYDRQKQAAPKLLQLPENKKNPAERARLEALINEAPPEHVGRAGYYLGVLYFEGGRFADAQTRFAAFVQQFPRSSLAAAARLRLGASQVEARMFNEAVQTLRPLVDKEPSLDDQTLFWLARAWTGLIDPKNPQANPQAVQGAVEAQRGAADKARARAATDPEAKARLGQVMLDRADLLLLTGQYRDAAAGLRQLLTDALLPERRHDEVLQRLAAALHLLGEHAESEKVCERFLKEYPRSPLLPLILFRHAENAAFQYLSAEREGSKDLPRLNDEVAKRYQLLLDKYPEFEHAGRARFGLAMCLSRKGDLEKAKTMLESIPASDHTDDLAVVPYLLTDWLIRLTPTRAEDALQAAKMQEQLTTAIPLLQTFVDANPKSPLAPDALLKLGICKQRLATLAEKPQERTNILGSAGRRFDRLIQTYPNDERVPQARLERARCKALAGDTAGATEDLRRFVNDPILKANRIAPLAALQLATLLRAQNKPAEAAAALSQCRQDQEPGLLKDPVRAGWAPQMRLQEGIALKEANKPAEARALLETIPKQFPNAPEVAEAFLRFGQCLKEESLAKMDAGWKWLTKPGASAEEIARAVQRLGEDAKELRAARTYFEGRAEDLKKKLPESEMRARMLYEAAWLSRILAEVESAEARYKLAREGHKEGQPFPPLADVLRDNLPASPEEKTARDGYEALIEAFPDLPLAVDARLELSELLARRGEHDAAIKVISQAMDKEPAPELTDKLRLQLGFSRAAKGDMKGALEQFAPIEKNPKSPLNARAHLWAGESLMRAGDWQGAAQHLTPFRDQQPLRNVPGSTDHGLLRLGQAYAQLGQWDHSRQAFERLVGEQSSSPLVAEAHWGIGWARQNQKDFDSAVNAYLKAAESPTRTGARAALQAGQCRMEQKRFPDAATLFKGIVSRVAYPDLAAAGLLEAARAHAEQKQKDEAEKLLEQLLKDYPRSPLADAARTQQKALKDGVALQRPAAVADLLTIDGKRPLSLPELAQAVVDRASLEDPTTELAMGIALAPLPLGSKTPVPFLRVRLPDPFEFRAANRPETDLRKDAAAALPAWPTGS